MKINILPFVVLLSLSASCEAQPCAIKISTDFFNIDLLQKENVFSVVFEEDLSAIPCLINLIDVDEKSQVGFHNFNSSFFREFSQINYKGIKAAYLIECLIRVPPDKINDAEALKLFGYCVIAPVRNGEPQLEPLSYADMKVIKGLYRSWWEKNKNKSLYELRKENFDVLKGSGYVWM